MTIGSLVLVQRASDFRIVPSLMGWGDAPPIRTEIMDITGRHGATASAGLFAGRPIGVGGYIEQPSHADAIAVRNQLTALGIGTSHLVTVDEGDVPATQVEARVSKGAVVEWINNVTFRYSLELVALDPFRRGITPRTTVVGAGSSVAAVNDGTAAAEMLVTLTSGGTVVLSAGGLTLTTGTLPAGAVIDTANTSVRASDGSDLFQLVTLPPMWPALPKGGGTVQQAGTAALSIEHFDTYA